MGRTAMAAFLAAACATPAATTSPAGPPPAAPQSQGGAEGAFDGRAPAGSADAPYDADVPRETVVNFHDPEPGDECLADELDVSGHPAAKLTSQQLEVFVWLECWQTHDYTLRYAARDGILHVHLCRRMVFRPPTCHALLPHGRHTYDTGVLMLRTKTRRYVLDEALKQ